MVLLCKISFCCFFFFFILTGVAKRCYVVVYPLNLFSDVYSVVSVKSQDLGPESDMVLLGRQGRVVHGDRKQT